MIPGSRPPKWRYRYSPVKSRKLPVGGPSKRPRPANSGPEAKNHDWNDWVKAVEKYDSELVVFYSTLYLSASIATTAVPVSYRFGDPVDMGVPRP